VAPTLLVVAVVGKPGPILVSNGEVIGVCVAGVGG